jgi:small conductance mechanosensitive channel
MLQAQWIQVIWLAVTLAGLAIAGYLLMKFFRFELHQVARRTVKEGILDESMSRWVEDVARVLRTAVFIVVVILSVFFTLRVIGHPAVISWSPASIVNWLIDRGLRIVLIVVASYLAIKLSHPLLSKLGLLIRPYDDSPAAEIERVKRAETLSSVLGSLATVLIILVTVLMLLEELNVDTTPLLASVGVIGVAVGFGAQQLVKDVIAGFFMIFENEIRVGDVAVINGTGGLVQEMRLRSTILRGIDGTVHVFANGNINTLSNMTKGFSYYVVNLGVAYKEDTDRVCEVVREVVTEMQTEEKFSLSILEPVEILGVDDFADSAVVIKLRIKTLPIKQWEVGREFRRRIKYRFGREGIEIPFPHRSIYFGEASRPFAFNAENGGPLAAARGSDAAAKQ